MQCNISAGECSAEHATDSYHDLPVAPNLLARQFTVVQPDKVWAGDVTRNATHDSCLFLAVEIDLISRHVIDLRTV